MGELPSLGLWTRRRGGARLEGLAEGGVNPGWGGKALSASGTHAFDDCYYYSPWTWS